MFTPAGGTTRELQADSVVLAGTVEPDTTAVRHLVAAMPAADVHAAGDCTGLGLIRKATEEGARAACAIYDRRKEMTQTEESQATPALAASQASWRCVQAHDREGWLALMADDVVIEDPIGKSLTNPDGTGRPRQGGRRRVLRHQHRRQSADDHLRGDVPVEFARRDRPHLGAATASSRAASPAGAGGVHLPVNDAGLITNMRGYWNLDMMQFGKED